MMQMCGEQVLVQIPDMLWDAGAIHNFDAGHPEYGVDGEGRRCLRLDACIVPAVKVLWSAGFVTLSCCCGHGDPWGVITIQTQAGVGQRGAMVLRAERYDELIAAEADLAAANATIAAQRLALATMREALSPVLEAWRGANDDFPVREILERVKVLSEWEARFIQPADTAAALAGAVLAAADRMAGVLVSRSSPPGTLDWKSSCTECMTSWWDGEPEQHTRTCATGAYRRARAALRGHGAAEG